MPMTYEIRIEGHLGPDWADWFANLHILLDEDGSTRLVGHVIDQAALHAIIRQIRDLGLPLLSVVRLAT